MATIDNIITRAEEIRDETAIGANTATRVGSVMKDTADHIKQNEQDIASILSAMISEGVIPLKNIGPTGVGFISAVGQYYFNTLSNTLKYCTGYVAANDFTTIDIALSDKQLFVYQAGLLFWDGAGFKLAYRDINYSMLDIDILSDYTDYKDTIAEVFVVAPIQSGVSLGIKKYSNSIYVGCRNSGGYTEWCSSRDVANAENFVVYPISATTAGTGVNVGDIVGYVVFKDIAKFLAIANDTGYGRVVSKEQATDINFAPIIGAYLLFNDTVSSQGAQIASQSQDINNLMQLYPIGEAFDSETQEIQNTPLTNTQYESDTSTFSGWGMPLCEDEKFNNVTINVKNRADSAITSVTMWLRKDDYDGEILAQKTESVNIAPNAEQDVTFSFDSDVEYTGLIYIQYACGKYITRLGWTDATDYKYKYSAGYPRCGYFVGNNPSFFTSSSDESAFWVKYEKKVVELTDEQIENIEERIGIVGGDEIAIALPNTINAVVGDTLQLYYKSIFRCVDPFVYDIKVTCNIGAQYPRYYEVTPSDSQIGSHTLTFTIKDNNNNLINAKTVTLNVCKKVSSPTANILCVGASNTAGGQWVAELKKRLTTATGTPTESGGNVLYTPIGFSLPNVDFVGRLTVNNVNLEATGGYNFNSYLSTTLATVRFFFTQENVPQGIALGDVYSDGTTNYTIKEINIPDLSQLGGYYGNINFEVVSLPQTIGNNLTRVTGSGDLSLTASSHTSSGNPFVYNGTIDIQSYADDFCDGQIDVVYTDLFGNGMVQQYQSDFTSTFASFAQFVNMFRAVFPSCKFCIGMSQDKDEKGGLGVNYGAGTSAYAYPYGMKYGCHNLLIEFQKYIVENSMDSYVYIFNTLNEFDAENDYQQTEKQVNPRSALKEIFGVNGAHPSNVGYYQFADAAVRVFIANFCQ